MNFEKGFVYHVYNRGNNGERIFYSYSNYHFFLQKMDYHVSPFADILTWCLMPNHFHLMLYVNREKIFKTTINQSIGKMLSSYARAVNIQENRSGSLFQQHSKAICLNGNQKIKPSWFKVIGATKLTGWDEKSDYPKICMNYIHLNPVKSGLVMEAADWNWSSFQEIYKNNGNYKLVNLDQLKNVVSL